MSQTVPRILICAPASGCGKTTVVCAILQALVNRGVYPVAFKSGPDYIDPMFHSEIIGAKSRNLDLFFLDQQAIRFLLQKNAQGSALAVIEGAMGYYDGVAHESIASAYHLAQVTETPAVLVVDARGAALSVAALVKGFACFRTDSGLRGVLLNRVSPARYPALKACIERETGLTVFGYLPVLGDCTLENRHLGLVTAAEVSGLKHKLALLAEQAERSIDLDGLLSLGQGAPALAAPPPEYPPACPIRPRIAVARDRAFCFYYEDALRLLEQLGAELVEFSPIEDPALPSGCSGLYLGGGYPELYAQALAGNSSMRQAVKQAVMGHMPCVAECGGFLYLHESLEDTEGTCHPMAGVIAATAVRDDRLGRQFGYVTLTAECDNLLCNRGQTIPAHEFHYWQSKSPGEDFTAWKPANTYYWPCIHTTPTLYAGFPHFHFCARPAAAARFVAACAKYREEYLCR